MIINSAHLGPAVMVGPLLLAWYVSVFLCGRGIWCLEGLVGLGPASTPVRGPFALQAPWRAGSGGCRSQGCHGYPTRSALIACGSTILLGTIPQAHLLLMSLTL